MKGHSTMRGPARNVAARRAPARHTAQVLAVATVAAGAIAIPLAQQASAHSAKDTVVVKTAKRGNLGTILVSAKGATLYHYTPDGPNKPTCTGGCASAWPPLLLPAGTTVAHGAKGVTGLGTVKLASGRLQVTDHKVPLYRFSGDKGSSTHGQGIGGIWFVVHPKGATTAGASGTTSTTASSGYSY